MWKCETCRDTYKAFDFQCHKRQVEKKKIKRITKNKSIYHAIHRKNANKTISSQTQSRTFIDLNFIEIKNDLKKKSSQKRLAQKSRFLSVMIASNDIIVNRLLKKSKSNENENALEETSNASSDDVITSITFISTMSKNSLTRKKVNASLTTQNTQESFEKLWRLNEINFEYYNTTFTSQETKWW